MKLQGVQAAFVDSAADEVLRRIHEYANPGYERRQITDDPSSLYQRDIARTLRIKHEAQRVGSRFDSRASVGSVRNAADLDFQAHPKSKLGQNRLIARDFLILRRLTAAATSGYGGLEVADFCNSRVPPPHG